MTVNPTSFRLPIPHVNNAQPVRPPATPPAAQPGSPAAAAPAPEGVNPELWTALTEAEQAFFLRQSSLGPLTYGPKSMEHANADAPLGQRIDVRA